VACRSQTRVDARRVCDPSLEGNLFGLVLRWFGLGVLGFHAEGPGRSDLKSAAALVRAAVNPAVPDTGNDPDAAFLNRR
jgi:hypothetical protein